MATILTREWNRRNGQPARATRAAIEPCDRGNPCHPLVIGEDRRLSATIMICRFPYMVFHRILSLPLSLGRRSGAICRRSC